MGVHKILSLLNGTECISELDQIYSQFKPGTKKSIKRFADMKMFSRVEARKKSDDKEQEDSVRQESFATEFKNYLDEQEANLDKDDDKDGAIALQVGCSVCNVTLTYKDISTIVNGYPGDPIDLRPFDY